MKQTQCNFASVTMIFREHNLQPNIVKAHTSTHTSFQQVKVHLKFNLGIMCAASEIPWEETLAFPNSVT